MSSEATFTLTLGHEDREVFMSYGLLNELSKVIGEPTAVGALGLDPELTEQVLGLVLTPRSKSGKPTGPAPELLDVELTLEQVDDLLTWVASHLLDFFIRNLSRADRLGKERKTELERLGLLSTGSNA